MADESAEQATTMLCELVELLEANHLGIKWSKVNLRARDRPCRLRDCGQTFVAAEDMKFLGTSVVSGAEPEVTASVNAAWWAFHAKEVRWNHHKMTRRMMGAYRSDREA